MNDPKIQQGFLEKTIKTLLVLFNAKLDHNKLRKLKIDNGGYRLNITEKS